MLVKYKVPIIKSDGLSNCKIPLSLSHTHTPVTITEFCINASGYKKSNRQKSLTKLAQLLL